jgi:hypothetical protein
MTVGIPADAANATNNYAKIEFLKDGTTQLRQTLDVWQGSPKTVTVHLDNSSHLEIYCASGSYGVPGDHGDNIDVTLGDAGLARP